MISNAVVGILFIVALIVVLFFTIIVASFFKTWLRAKVSGAPVSFLELIGLWLQRVPIALVVDCRVMSVKAGIELPLKDLQAHYMAGGDVYHTVQALIAADKAGLNLDFRRAAAIDLATKQSGKNVYSAVMTSVNPRVIDCPSANSGKNTIDAVAKDGIQLQVKARVTVRTNLERFVGGATEETIIARVGEGIVTTIGSADSYKVVLENPDMVSKRVLDKGLDAGTAFEILSVDVADVDVGNNVGAILQAKQADADKQVAQARAEIRRATAVALEQEMKARTQEMKARVTEAEAQVPLAMAEAFRTGRLGVMDYYRMQNIQADTSMRGSIAGDNRPHTPQ